MSLTPDEILSRIDAELRKNIVPAYADYFKRKTTSYQHLGVRTPVVQKIGNIFFRELKTHNIKDIESILSFCEHLLSARISEYRTIAFQWSFKCKNQFQPKHFAVFERWAKTQIDSWGSTDNLCVTTLGYFLWQYPDFIPQVKTWVTSPNPWVRRASAVIFIYSLRRGKYLAHIFDIADALLMDSDIYVLKGYGWMLKEASNRFQEEVFQYVLKNKATMPRVSLRYAIEKMPEEMRAEAMKK